jgi:outer membrane receptor protein involved in Fe transport
MSKSSRPGFNKVAYAVGIALLGGAGTATAQTPSVEMKLDEVIVTAQRREEKLTEVPISIAAYGQEAMDRKGVTSIDDLARITPGITFARADTRNSGASNIAIRGIRSTVATSTTGIYLDETPIQTRIIGAGASNYPAFPAVFDLERVEVLRGPQGTLFGAGSEGGTVRFITPKPSYDKYSAYARVDLSQVNSGGKGYEAGGAFGGPIIQGKLGFRISGLMRRTGGFVDRVSTDPAPGDTRSVIRDADPSTPPSVFPVRDTVRATIAADSNWSETEVAKIALSYAPTDTFDITASYYYQVLDYNDTNQFWRTISDENAGKYRQGSPIGQPSHDKFVLPSITMNWDLGSVALVSNTSYFDRHQEAINDYTAFESGLWTGIPAIIATGMRGAEVANGLPPGTIYPVGYNPYGSWMFPVGYVASALQINTQRGWTQEFRLESNNPASPVQWVVGAFWQKYRQESKQAVDNRGLDDLYRDMGFSDGYPYAPYSSFAPGSVLSQGLYTFNQDSVIAFDKQIAAFAQIDYKPIEQLTLTLGLRYADAKFSSSAYYDGLVVGPEPVNDSGSSKEKPFTPKFSVAWQFAPDNLLYATAAKGFRLGGYNPEVGGPCASELADLGYADGRPITFDSDSLWSYEAGSKNVIGGGRAQISGSVYYIDWKNIQSGVGMQCGFGFTANLGSATSRGFDLEGFVRLGSLTLGSAVGYNDAEFNKTVFNGSGAVVPVVTKGDKIVGSPWTVALNGQYDFRLAQQDAYFRADYEYASKGGITPGLNPGNRAPSAGPLDPLVAVRAPATSQLALRAGVRIASADISVYAKNLLNENPLVARGNLATVQGPPPYFGPAGLGYTGMTITPRTVGLTATYRY